MDVPGWLAGWPLARPLKSPGATALLELDATPIQSAHIRQTFKASFYGSTGKPNWAATTANSSASLDGDAAVGHAVPKGPSGTENLGAARLRLVKSSTSARLFAIESRIVSG